LREQRRRVRTQKVVSLKKRMAELKRLFASLENAELAYRAQIDEEHSLILNQLHALSAHSHMVKHKYLTTMKDTFAG
jgi:hypothetical protein